MNKKSKRKNDLRSSIILLLILLLLLITSTYAWFTANQTVTISSLDVHIEAKNGLQISSDATTWKSILENTDIASTAAYDGNTNQIPTSMEPVSTVGAIEADTGNMLMYYGTVAADENDGGAYKLTATKETDAAGTTGKYIAFDIFLRVDKDTQLKMTTGSNVIMKEGSSDQGIKQASRVAFCLQGTKPAGTALADITGQKGAVSFGESGSTVYIWEPNSNWHTAAAVAHARDNYAITTTQSEDGSSVTAVPYYGINQVIDTGIKLADTNKAGDAHFTAVTPSYVTESGADGMLKAEQNIFSLKAGITKARVYMWIEGQDVDCENTASGTDISFNLQLQVVEQQANG
jgi:predicted ribosomally synthesized peptide with SipW-like signal peptide